MEDPAESVVRLRCGSPALELWTKKLNRNNTATRTHHIFIFVEEKTHHVTSNQVAIAVIIQVLSVVPPPFTAQITHLNKIGIKGSKKMQKKDN